MSGSEKENSEKSANKFSSKRAGIRKNHKDVFITRLRMLLNDLSITTVSWHPSGKAVMVDKRYIDNQVSTLFPECFGNDKFTSIRQNLGAHGFKSACKRQKMNDGIWKKYNHVLSSNRFLHIYEHELFRRDKPENDKLIKRVPVRRKPRVQNVLSEKHNTDNIKDVIKKEEDDEDEDQEPETARLNTNDRRPRRSEKLRWKFYSADDEDYKVSQALESDESQTPIAEDLEPPEAPPDGGSSHTADSEPINIKPVQDLVSPVLGSLEELEDTVRYSIQEAKDSAEWQRENQMQPEIQASSIWKPMTSPLGDPNAQLSAAVDSGTTDEVTKRCETPVDLSTREKIKTSVPQKTVKNKPKPTVVIEKNTPKPMHQSSSDDDMPDEETCSTLAAFCQAKVSALYSGMMLDEDPDQSHNNLHKAVKKSVDTKPAEKIEMKAKVMTAGSSNQVAVPKVLKSMPHLIQLLPPPHKRLKFAKPNKVKINLSMPLCSAVQSTNISDRINENVAFLNNQPSSMVLAPESKKLGTNSAPTDVSELHLCVSEETKPSVTSHGTDITPEVDVQPSDVFNDTKQSLPTVNPHFLFSPTSNEENEAFGQTTEVSATQTTFESEKSEVTKINLVPVAFAQPTQPTSLDINSIQTSQIQLVNTSVPFATFHQPLSEANPSVMVDVEKNISQQPGFTDSEPTQKLPSIDHIFKPLPTTSLVATPNVAANVEVSSMSVLGRTPQISLNVLPNKNTGPASVLSGSVETVPVQGSGLSPGCPMKRKSTGIKSKSSQQKSSLAPDGFKRYPTPKMSPYMYPYPPTGPGYVRWPAQYSWPPYVSMPGRYPPYYPCPLPNYNAYPQ